MKSGEVMRHEKIEYKSIEDLIPYARNQRIHSDEQVKKIAASIKEFGFKNPVIVDKDGTIIAGHGRCLAAEKLKIKELPVIVADDLNASQVKALRLADNKLQDLSEFDDELVKLELEELKSLDFDINLTGFDDLIDINALDELDDERLDEVPEAPKEPRTKQGDLYIIDGRHRVLCGDSTKKEDIERLMGGDKADMVFTDPPYGVKRDGGFGGFGGFGKPIKRREYNNTGWDDSIPPRELFMSLLSIAKRSMIFGGNFFAHILPQSKHWIVWDKKNTMPTFGDAEIIWTNIDRNSVKIKQYEYNGLINKEKERFHPTQKPIQLIIDILGEYSKAKELILDPYLGSGTTLIACEKTNRKSYGIEIDPIYCDVIIQRYKDLKPEAKIELNGEAIDW